MESTLATSGKDVKTNKTKTGKTVPKTQELQMTKSTNEIAKLSICKRLRILRAKKEIPNVLADNHTDTNKKMLRHTFVLILVQL